MERFMGILIEHFNGAFPLWLAPVQVHVLTISERHNAYAGEVVAALRAEGVRVEANLGSEKIGAKIRDATLQKVPYMLIIGEQEAERRAVAVRHRTSGDQGQMPLTEFIQRCDQEIQTRGAAHAVAGPA
jgi:threonyl-tRNA synthetase